MAIHEEQHSFSEKWVLHVPLNVIRHIYL
jgi:hypothetical protein